jgi:hypothetical protein
LTIKAVCIFPSLPLPASRFVIGYIACGPDAPTFCDRISR